MRAFSFYLFILERRSKRERKRETLICCSRYLRIHQSLLLCSLTRNQTQNLGVLGQCSKQLSYPTRASFLSSFIYLFKRLSFPCYFLKRFYLFLEREERGEERERNINVWLPLTCPTAGDLARNPGVFSD